MEKVIFREEYDRYTKEWGYIAVFPEVEANYGCIGAIPFKVRNGNVVYEPFTEASMNYVLSKKIVHKRDARIPLLAEAIEMRIGEPVKVVEKVTRR